MIDVEFTDVNGSPDYIKMTRIDLVGNAAERGYAHGYLLANEIFHFFKDLDVLYAQMIMSIDISRFPENVQTILNALKAKGAANAPQFFNTAYKYIYESESKYFPQYLVDEMNGIGEGICAFLGNECQGDHDVEHWKNQVKYFNMFPELIKMTCTAIGAWGKAVKNQSGLLQVRALDFGSGPWSNNTIVYVYKDNTDASFNSFVAVSFPGFVGAITGMSDKGIAISEKVWMINNPNPHDDDGLQPGSYDGEADCFVLRDILQHAKNRKEAEDYLESVKRTWGIWMGIGDYESQQFDLVGYQMVSAIAYNDVTMPSMTGQPYMENICYVDKHPQPSWDNPNGTLPTALAAFYGSIDTESMKQILAFHETGDVHIALYDFVSKNMLIAIGKTNAAGEYGSDNTEWSAFNRPYVNFNLQDLFAN